MDLYEEIERLMKELTDSIRVLKENGSKLAEAERDYKVELCKQALILRADNTPVTLINTLIYGMPEVSDKRLKRDIAESTYEANKEHINVTKLKLRVLESQLEREWQNAGKG